MSFPRGRSLFAGALVLAVALSSLVAAPPAHAGKNDLQLLNLCTPQLTGGIQECGWVQRDASGSIKAQVAPTPAALANFRSLMSELGVVIAPRLITPADTLGYAGFQFSGELGITTINNNRKVSNDASGIAYDTSSVYLEGAYWNPAVIQGKMRRLGFQSDAGYRFERGVDFELGPRAVERATQLILEICGGRAGPLTDAVGSLPARTPVRLRSARVEKLLGVDPIFLDQFRAVLAGRRMRGRAEVVDFIKLADKLLGMAVAFQAPAHLQRVRPPH